MIGHNIRFNGVIWKIIPKLSLLPLLIWSTANICRSCNSVKIKIINGKTQKDHSGEAQPNEGMGA